MGLDGCNCSETVSALVILNLIQDPPEMLKPVQHDVVHDRVRFGIAPGQNHGISNPDLPRRLDFKSSPIMLWTRTASLRR